MIDDSTHIDYKTLMIRYIAGDADSDEQKRLLEWLKEDSSRIKELQELRKVHHTITSSHSKTEFNADVAFDSFMKAVPESKTISFRKIAVWAASIAALLVLFIGIKTFTTHHASHSTISLGDAVTVKKTIALIDGSTASLNAGSRIWTDEKFDAHNRSIHLKGEAFFEVHPDAAHPFSVTMDSVTVKVLGTAFNILPDSVTKNIVVTVRHGKVAVMYKNQQTIITAGMQATFVRKEEKIVLSKLNIENFDSWKTGQLVFNDTPLPEVIEALNKQYATRFEIASPELNEYKLNASFNYTDIKKVKELLSVVLKVDIKTENGKQLLYCKSK